MVVLLQREGDGSRFQRRRLPHWQQPSGFHFVTWRLAGTLPSGRNFNAATTVTHGEVFAALDRILDAAEWGPRFLGSPEIAAVVAEELRLGFGEQGTNAWVVMPNHVHVVTGPEVGDLSAALRLVKGRSARRCNFQLGRQGPFWQDESYDRWIRSPEELARIVRYVELNPVRAGLAGSKEEFRWSSAWRGGG